MKLKQWRKLLSAQEGTALVFTLLVAAVLMILASAIISVTGTDSQIASAQEFKKQAQYAAEAGFEEVKRDIESGAISFSPGPPGGSTTKSGILDPGISYSATIFDEGGNKFRIFVTGFFQTQNGELVRKDLEILYQANAPSPPTGPTVVDVAYVMISPPNLSLSVGQKGTFTATVIPWNATNKKIKRWTIDNPAVATITVSGPNNEFLEVTGKNIGAAIITAEAEGGGVPGTCIVEVKSATTTTSTSSPFDFALVGQGYSHGSLNLDGDFDIDGPIYSNTQIHLNGNKQHMGLEIEGDVISAADVKIIGNDVEVGGVIKENQPTIAMPVVDWEYLKQKAKDGKDYYEGNTTLDGATQIHDNSVIFVNGNLTLYGEISGTALVVATGDIIINGEYHYPGSDSSAVGFIIGNNFKLSGGSTGNGNGNGKQTDDPLNIEGPDIRGIVICYNNVIISGEAGIEGCLISGNNMECGSGELKIKYPEKNDEHNPIQKIFDTFGTTFIKNYDTYSK